VGQGLVLELGFVLDRAAVRLGPSRTLSGIRRESLTDRNCFPLVSLAPRRTNEIKKRLRVGPGPSVIQQACSLPLTASLVCAKRRIAVLKFKREPNLEPVLIYLRPAASGAGRNHLFFNVAVRLHLRLGLEDRLQI